MDIGSTENPLKVEPNPYKAPNEKGAIQNPPFIVLFRALAIVFWIVCPYPAISFLIPLAVFGIPATRRELSYGVYVIVLSLFIRPTIGLALFGAACWWRRRWLAFAGLATFMPLGAILVLALARHR
jgi:hypothetical protein